MGTGRSMIGGTSVGATAPRDMAQTAASAVMVPANVTIMDHSAAGKRPGNVCIDVVFPAPTKVARVCFRNWYTAQLTVRATVDRAVLSRKDTDRLDGWFPLVQDCRLMHSPHSETESQLWHSIGPDQWLPGAADEAVVGLRFFLQQPSPNWKQIGLKNISVSCWGNSAAPGSAAAGNGTGSAMAAQLSQSAAVAQNIANIGAAGRELFAALRAFTGPPASVKTR